VPFRPRGAPPGWSPPRRSPALDDGPVADLAKFEKPESEDDYRHRMKMNALALIVTILLMMTGWWLAETMAEMRKLQDCVLSGRRDCVQIAPLQMQRP
jgi:hypothetical protein